MIIFFDTETTGLAPGNVIQLSYIMLEGDSVTGKNFWFYCPYIEPSATLVHGITVEKLATLSGGHTFFEYLEEIDDDFRRADLTVAHNFPFDFKFMSAEFGYNDRIFHYKEKFDTMRFFTPYVKMVKAGGRGYKYPKLSELAEFFDIYPYDVNRRGAEIFGQKAMSAHDARFDTVEMFMCFMQGAVQYEEVDKVLREYGG